MTAEKCTWCDQPATGYTTPPACEKHADLLLLIDYQQEKGRPVTVANTLVLFDRCQANNGDLYIDRYDVQHLLPEMLAALPVPGEIKFLGGAA